MRRVFTHRNRHALAVLGLYVLGYGLVVAPLWHALVDHAGAALSLDSPWVQHANSGPSATTDAHAHGHGHRPAGGADAQAHHAGGGTEAHEHGDAPDAGGHTHAPGALEHLATVFVATKPPTLILVASAAPVFRTADARPALGGRLRHPAMPQGP